MYFTDIFLISGVIHKYNNIPGKIQYKACNNTLRKTPIRHLGKIQYVTHGYFQHLQMSYKIPTTNTLGWIRGDPTTFWKSPFISNFLCSIDRYAVEKRFGRLIFFCEWCLKYWGDFKSRVQRNSSLHIYIQFAHLYNTFFLFFL